MLDRSGNVAYDAQQATPYVVLEFGGIAPFVQPKREIECTIRNGISCGAFWEGGTSARECRPPPARGRDVNVCLQQVVHRRVHRCFDGQIELK